MSDPTIRRYVEPDGTPPDLLDTEDRVKVDAALALLPDLWASVTISPSWEFSGQRKGDLLGVHLRGFHVLYESRGGKRAAGHVDVGWLGTPAQAIAEVLTNAGCGAFGIDPPTKAAPPIDPTAHVTVIA